MRLVVENLSVSRADRVIFSGLSFSLDTGRALVVTGPNGSGKSTLLKTIAGFLQPVCGSIRIDGPPDDETATACHYLAHANALKPALTVGENLAFWREFLGSPALDVGDALDAVGLAGLDDLPAGYLSAGQKRRVAIARLLVSHRPLWLIDEPTAALDAGAERRFGELLQGHLAGGGMAIAATHHKLAVTRPVQLDIARFGGERR